MTTLKNKIVWITGASSGIGEALAKVYSELGATLILSARREEELQRVAKECQPYQNEIMILPLDMCDFTVMSQAVKKILDKFHHIDILINNAGISQRGYAVNTEFSVDQKIMNTNFFGPVQLTKAVLPSMISRQTGHIVVVSSVTGHVGIPYRTAYSASKHAIQGYFNGLRGELARDNIYVTLICPGFIRTNISFHALHADGKEHNTLDKTQAKGMSSFTCAKKIIKAIKKRKREVTMGGIEIYAIWLQRFFPGLVATVLKRIKPIM